jgi:hypothetical protein
MQRVSIAVTVQRWGDPLVLGRITLPLAAPLEGAEVVQEAAHPWSAMRPSSAEVGRQTKTESLSL